MKTCQKYLVPACFAAVFSGLIFSVPASAQEVDGVAYSMRAYQNADQGQKELKQKAMKAQNKIVRKAEAPDQNNHQVLKLQKLSADDLQKVAFGSDYYRWRIQNRFWLDHQGSSAVEEPVDEGDVKIAELEKKRQAAAAAREKAAEAKKLAESQKDSAAIDDFSFSVREDDNYVYFEFDLKIAPEGIIELVVAPREPTDSNYTVYHSFIREAYDSIGGGRSKSMECNGRDLSPWHVREGFCDQKPSNISGHKVIPVAIAKEKLGKPGMPVILDVQVFRWFENDGASLDGKLPGESSVPVVISGTRRRSLQNAFRDKVLEFYKETKGEFGKKAKPSIEFNNWTWINWRGTLTVNSHTTIWQRERRAAFLLKSMADLFLAESGFIPKYLKELKDTAPLYTEMAANPYLNDFIQFGRYREFTQPEKVRKEKAKDAIRDKMFSSNYPDCEVE